MCAFMFASCSKTWNDSELKESWYRGDKIVKGLEKYRIDFGSYPNNLNDLVPKYISSIEQPTVGKKIWEYTKVNNTHYVLSFHGVKPNDPSSWIITGQNKWSYDTK